MFKFSKPLTIFLLILFTCFSAMYSFGEKKSTFQLPMVVKCLADFVGFSYDYEQNIYVTNQNAPQRLLGYNWVYDKFANPVGMVIDEEPVRFWHNGKKYMIELWKGQYYASTGSEVGFYIGTGKGEGDEEIFRCANDEEKIYMSYTLLKSGKKIYSREGIHWWLTGFKPGEFSSPDTLVLEDVHIEFKVSGMYEAFEKALIDLGYHYENDNILVDPTDNSVTFTFSEPKSEQPQSEEFRETMLMLTEGTAITLNLIKKVCRLENFSPESIGKILEGRFFI